MPGADDELAVDVSHVFRVFGTFAAVRDLSFQVPSTGTILGIIGPSGSGKTTTIRMLTGALKPSSGHVRVLGEEPAHFSRATRERIGYLPQLFSLYPDLSVGQNVTFVASMFGMLWPRRRRRVPEVLRLVELDEVRGRRAGALSGGMQRRLELACALVNEPRLTFLDEPTAGLDPLLRASVWKELKRMRDAGRTVLVTTQVVGESEACDMVALISDGRLIALGSPRELTRLATGGDLLELGIREPIDARRLFALPAVHRVAQLDERHLQLTVDDAAVATPAVIAEVERAGGEVSSVDVRQPGFDEVFAILVERDQARAAAEASTA